MRPAQEHRSAAGGDATPSASRQEKYDQIGPDTLQGHCPLPWCVMPVSPRAASTLDAWDSLLRFLDDPGERPRAPPAANESISTFGYSMVSRAKQGGITGLAGVDVQN